MKVFVTGGAGFIGSNFIRHVLSLNLGYEIVNYDKLTYAGNLANVESVADNQNYSFVRGDICNGTAVEESMRGCDAVVHFAAESHVDRSISEPAPVVETNVTGTFILLEVARKLHVERFVHISTDEVYGDMAPGTFADENFYIRPSSPYAASKAASDLLVRSYVRTYGFPGNITGGLAFTRSLGFDRFVSGPRAYQRASGAPPGIREAAGSRGPFNCKRSELLELAIEVCQVEVDAS
jgi:dTDP-glucose 4,6-dehydratase